MKQGKNNASRRKSRRPRRLKGLSVQGLIPNAITVAATCAGLTGMRFALEGRWEFAVGAILVAAILDALDGRMARLLNASSEFGAQLDSLSDFVAFGVCPAFILYHWSLNGLGGYGWAIALFLAVCCMLRLARFNSRIDSLPPYAYNYFQGVPAPAGAGLALFPIIASLGLTDGSPPAPGFIAAWTIMIGLLMVSEIPTFSFKRFKVPGRFVLPAMALVGLFVAGVAGKPWITLSVVLLAYLALIPFSYQRYRRLQQEAANLQASETEDGPADDEIASDRDARAVDTTADGPTDEPDGDPNDGPDDGSKPVHLRTVR